MIFGLLTGGGLYVLSRVNHWQSFSARERYKSDLRGIANRRQLTAALSKTTLHVQVDATTTPKDQP